MITDDGHALFRERFEAASRIVLTTHINPDGDALGSELALGRFLIERGKQVRVVNHDPTPRTLQFLEDPALPTEHYDPATHDALFAECDLIILVDNAVPDRLGRVEPVMLSVASRTMCIDHHPSRNSPWASHILDDDACATTAMIYELTRRCGWQPDLRAAEALYVGLVTDTGFFRFNSTNPRAHEIAAELLRLGVSPAKPYQAIYERNSRAFTQLLGHALADLQLTAGGRIAVVKISKQLIQRLGAEDEDISEISTSLLAMDGICLSLLFRELPNGRVKVSLRSKAGVDVHRLASEYGGGGHRNASGIVSEGSLEEVARRVTERAAEVLA